MIALLGNQPFVHLLDNPTPYSNPHSSYLRASLQRLNRSNKTWRSQCLEHQHDVLVLWLSWILDLLTCHNWLALHIYIIIVAWIVDVILFRIAYVSPFDIYMEYFLLHDLCVYRDPKSLKHSNKYTYHEVYLEIMYICT